jgi:hypothetical protein
MLVLLLFLHGVVVLALVMLFFLCGVLTFLLVSAATLLAWCYFSSWISVVARLTLVLLFFLCWCCFSRVVLLFFLHDE